jgi:lysozyme
MTEPVKKRSGTVAMIAAAVVLAAPLVAHFEGKRNAPYFDSVRIRTVCYGHTGGIQERLYSNAECDALFRDDLASHAAPVAACVPGIVDKPQILAASTSLAFNIGAARFCHSTAARRFNAGDLAGGCRALGAYQYAGGRKLPGLTRRRNAEVALCLEGVGQ